jgi:AAA family ATP:ADP antiporter
MEVKPHELKRVLLAQLYVFILITTLLMVKPTISSLFLSELTSEALPLAYLFTALFAVVFSVVYERIIGRFSLKRIIPSTLVFCGLLLIGFSLILKAEPGFAYWLYVPYLFVAIYGLLTTSQFWILANLIFNAREAKRLFGFIGAGAIAGGIFGGYLTSLLARVISSEDILIVAALMLMGCIPISRYLWNKHVHMSRVAVKKDQAVKSSPLKLIKGSRLLTLVTLSIGIGVIVAKLVDYQYSHFAAEKLTDKDELTAFFGFWFSTLSVVSLVIQLFFTKWIMLRLGLDKALLFLPVGILLGSVLLLLIPELWVVVLIKIADGSFKQSVNKAGTELLFIPIPIEIKKRTKTYIDVVVDSVATGLAGITLIFLINGLKIPSVYISYINIALILVWVFVLSKNHKAYLAAFRSLLIKEHPHARGRHEHKHLDTSLESVYATVDRVLRDGSESQILHMLEELLHNPDEHYFEALKKLLDHPSPKIKSLAISNLYFLVSEDLTARMKEMLRDPDDQVVIHAMRYLIHKNYGSSREDILEFEANSDHENIKALTLWAIAEEVHTDPHLQEVVDIEARVAFMMRMANEGPMDERKEFAIKTAIEAIGHTHLVAHYDTIAHYLESENEELVVAAMDSASQVKSDRFVPLISNRLHTKSLRAAAESALLAYGEAVIPLLYREVISHTVDFKNTLFIPEIIEKFGSKLAVSTLTSLIDDAEYAVSIKVIEAIKRLKTDYPELPVDQDLIVGKILEECKIYQNMLSMLHAQVREQDQSVPEVSPEVKEARNGLIVILEHRLDGHLGRIFKLLGIRYYDQDIDQVLKVIVSGEDQERANAIEYLDNILERSLKHHLLPIIDSASIGQSYSEMLISKFRLPDYSEYECFEILLDRHDIKVKHAVLYLIQQKKRKEYLPLVKKLLSDATLTVRKQAEQVAAQLGY